MNKLKELRSLMEEAGASALLVPQTDEFQGEWISPYAERLQWLTEFTGSAGIAIITQDKAAFFTDGRYTLQAQKQLNSNDYEILNITQFSPEKWLHENTVHGAKVGFDPWLHTEAQLQKYKKSGIALSPLKNNLIDLLWKDQPERSKNFIYPHPDIFAGESDKEKRERISKIIAKNGADVLLLTTSDSIAWILNIRGKDLPYSPAPHCYALLKKNSHFDLFIDLDKITGETFNHLRSEGNVIALQKMGDHISSLKKGTTIQIDPSSCPIALIHLLENKGFQIHYSPDPCTLDKALKNSTEIEGMRQAHIQDGIALCKFIAWLDKQPLKGEVTECSAAEKLAQFREKGQHFRGLSFPTIAGFGPHGAIIHYGPNETTDVPLQKNSLFLVDSGGQYLNGTTDVTRTIALGKPSAEQIDRFTCVLKGHIALATAEFPEGTIGAQLDVLARMPLWKGGVDYEHGTGHGVGAYLNVHEGPQNISTVFRDVPLQSGMIISNEPGYYKPGEYGIRIENLVLITPTDSVFNGKHFLKFETITLAPIDLNLIDSSALTAQEIEWLNTYHQQIKDTLSPHLDEITKVWLEKATEEV